MKRRAKKIVRARKRSRHRQKGESYWDRYPLPFFNLKKRSFWEVNPTGNYETDCVTGKMYATQFLQSCDGTDSWAHLPVHIVADMIRAGFADKDALGKPRADGIVVAFMLTLGFDIAARYAARKAVRS